MTDFEVIALFTPADGQADASAEGAGFPVMVAEALDEEEGEGEVGSRRDI